MELNENGMAQAEAAAREIWPQRTTGLGPIQIVTSPLARAVATAKALERLSGVPARVTGDLADMDYGALEGLTVEEAEKRFPDTYRAWQERPASAAFPGGESMEEAFQRIQAFLMREFLSLKEGCIVAVTHRVPIKLMIMSVLGLPLSAFWRLRVDNASISVAEHNGRGEPVLVSMNDTSHLKARPPVPRDF